MFCPGLRQSLQALASARQFQATPNSYASQRRHRCFVQKVSHFRFCLKFTDEATRSEQWHEDEEGSQDAMQLDNTQDSVISSLQNVKRLRSPPRLSGPSHSESDRLLSTRRWDVTPPTSATATGRPQDLQQILASKPQTNGASNGPPRQPDGAYRQIQPTGPDGSRQSGPGPNHSQHQHRDSQMMDHPPLEPDENKTISRPAEVRELSSEARCGSCHLAGRRCYIDSANPRHCVSCPTENHCIFRRTVVREGPATHFLWHELVGLNNIPQAMPVHHQQMLVHPPPPHQQPPPPIQMQPHPPPQGPQQPGPQGPPRQMEVTMQHGTPHHPPPHPQTPSQTPAQQQLQGPQAPPSASQSQSQGAQNQGPQNQSQGSQSQSVAPVTTPGQS